MDSVNTRDSDNSDASTFSVHPEDSISHVGTNDTRPLSYGPMAAFLASSQEPRDRVRASILPPIQMVEARPYREDSPPVSIRSSSSSIQPAMGRLLALQTLHSLSGSRPPNTSYPPEPTTPRSLVPSTPHTFADSSRPLSILNFGEPRSHRPRSPPRENSIVMPAPMKFVRFVDFNGEHQWPFDEVDRDSVQSGETNLSEDFQSSPTREERGPPRVRDSRWVPKVVDPWDEEENQTSDGESDAFDLYQQLENRRGTLTVRNSAQSLGEEAEQRRAFFASAPIEQFRPPQRPETESTASSESSRLSQETMDSYRRDHLANVSNRPRSRQAEFFFLPNNNVSDSSRSLSLIPAPESAVVEQPISSGRGKSRRSRSRKHKRLANSPQHLPAEALGRAQTEQPSQSSNGRIPIDDSEGEDEDWTWRDAHCDLFRSHAFKGKSLDLTRGNTRLPLPGDKEFRQQVREPRLRAFLERWVRRYGHRRRGGVDGV